MKRAAILALAILGLADAAGAQSINGFPVPHPSIQIAVGPDGALWFTEFESYIGAHNGSVGRIDRFGNYTPFATGGDPYGIAAGPDNGVWFADPYGNQIGRIDVHSGEINIY